MNTYLLTVPDTTPAPFDPTQLTTAIARWWPQKDLHIVIEHDDDYFLVSWYIRFPEAGGSPAWTRFLSGGLEHNRRTLGVRGSLDRCLECALHVRVLLPPTIPLHFSKHGSDNMIGLVHGITKPQLFAHFVPSLSPLAWHILDALEQHNAPLSYAHLIQQVRADVDVSDQINKELYALWRIKYITAPGTQWLPEDPPDIDELFDAPAWHTSLLTIQPDGSDALIAKAGANHSA